MTAEAMLVAERSGAVEVAVRWVERAYSAICCLAAEPRQFSRAEESKHRDCIIRQLRADQHVVLFSIDEAEMVVRVIGFRQATRMPKPC